LKLPGKYNSILTLLVLVTLIFFMCDRTCAQGVISGNSKSTLDDGAEYLIISGDVEGFKSILTELVDFRTEQGILTKLVMTNEIGGSSAEDIENYINEAWLTWNIPPKALLLVGDYEQIESPLYTGKGEKNDISDNIYADVNQDHIPDIVVARLPFSDQYILSNYIDKIITYEMEPPTNPGYYNNPVTSMGWFDNSDNMICAEATNGFFKNELEKSPLRENAIAFGTPGNSWMCSPNLVSYFGPNGLNYIPETPEYLTYWGANADSINENLNNGAFLILNLDNGIEIGWSYPEYFTGDILELFYSDPFFVISINNLNGKFNWSTDCFAEALMSHPNGSAGIIASTLNLDPLLTSQFYLYLIDGMWDNFIPDYSSSSEYPFVLPAFANLNSKLHLSGSALQNKENIYYGFHYFGEPFVPVIYDFPTSLEVEHEEYYEPGSTGFEVTATPGSIVALSSNNIIHSVETGTGVPQWIPANLPNCEDTLIVTVTQQNYIRYRQEVLCDYLGKKILNHPTDFNFYPNPAYKEIVIDIKDRTSKSISVYIYNAKGNFVSFDTFHSNTSGIIKVNLEDLPSGIYFLKVNSDNTQESVKAVIKR